MHEPALREGAFATAAGEDLVSEPSLQDQEGSERPREDGAEADSASAAAAEL